MNNKKLLINYVLYYTVIFDNIRYTIFIYTTLFYKSNTIHRNNYYCLIAI